MNNLDKIKELRDRGALFVVNHSGGKDSHAMLLKIKELVPRSHILVIHAVLPGVEWAGTEAHVYETSKGLDVMSVRAGKTFFDMVEGRGMWPSPKYRTCTSDLKRGPIEKGIRGYLKANPHFNGLVVNCVGIRAEESSARAKNEPFKFSTRNSKAGREWYDWLPIFDMTVNEVFATIKDAGESPFWVYEAGMTRMSCCFCIMGSKSDLRLAAELNPELFKKYVELERKIGHSFLMPKKGEDPKNLDEFLGIRIELG